MGEPKKRAKNGQFLPGNREGTGRKKIPEDVKKAFHDLTPKAITRLAQLLDSTNEKVAVQAVQEILNRALGKPVQATDVNMDVSGGLDLTAQIHAALLRREEERRNAGGG